MFMIHSLSPGLLKISTLSWSTRNKGHDQTYEPCNWEISEYIYFFFTSWSIWSQKSTWNTTRISKATPHHAALASSFWKKNFSNSSQSLRLLAKWHGLTAGSPQPRERSGIVPIWSLGPNEHCHKEIYEFESELPKRFLFGPRDPSLPIPLG